MILKYIHLVNFKKYKKASITLSRSMIGIFGNNGAGKSTLFEAVTWCLYGAAQSMEGREGVNQRDLIRDGEEEMGVEVEFFLGTHTYKIARYFNAKRGTKARLWIDKELQAVKSKEVISRVEQDLGLNVKGFISSSFIRQKELDLITSKIASERKKLINRLFNLRVYEKYEEAAKNRKKEKENELQGVQIQIKEKEKNLEQLPELEKALKELKQTVDTLKVQYETAKKESEAVKERYKALEKEYEQYQNLQSTVTMMENDMENAENALKERKSRLKEIEEAVSKKDALTPEYEGLLELKKTFSLLDTLKVQYDEKVNQVQNLQTEITVTQKNLEERIHEYNKEIRTFENEGEQLKESKSVLKTIREKIKTLENVPQKKEEEIQKIDKIKEKEAELKAEKAKYEGRISDLQKELKEVQSLGIGAPCPKCKRPLEKEHVDQLITRYTAEIGAHEKTREKYESKEDHLREMRKELDVTIDELKKKEKELNNLKKEEQKYVKAEIRIEDIQKMIKDARIKVAESEERLRGLHTKKEEVQRIKKEIELLEFDPAAYEKVKKEVDEKASIEREMIKLNERISKKGSVEESMREIEEKIGVQKKKVEDTTGELQKIADIPSKFDTIKKERDHVAQEELIISKEYTERKTQYTERVKELERLHKFREDLKEIKKKEKEIENTILVYGVLQDAFKQIPVQIQSRLRPRIRKETSEMLSEVTDGKYPFIDLEKDYSLTVYYDGTYYPISRFSGGEKDLINLCLRVGISRVLVSLSSQKSFAQIQSLFLDECFGSFDMERRKNLLAALNQLRKYFAQIVLITHIEEIKEALPEAFLIEEVEDGSSIIKKVK